MTCGFKAILRNGKQSLRSTIIQENIKGARKWAESAILYANESGHRTTRQAAHVNLGNIPGSTGATHGG